MNLYRISRRKFVRDLRGEGARLFGGRWNEKGVPMLYTSQHISLTAMETLVHTPIASIPDDLQLITLFLPDDIQIKEIPETTLPDFWRKYPPPGFTITKGSEWIRSDKTLALKVPSVIIPSEFNILLNPDHTEIKRVEIIDVQNFSFDGRLVN